MRLPRLPLALLLSGVLAAPLAPASAFGSASASAPAASAGDPAARKAAAGRKIAYTQWDSRAQLRAGSLSGTRVRGEQLVLGRTKATSKLGGKTYDVGQWTSPWTAPGFGLTELIASWSAQTPRQSFIEVQVRGKAADGGMSSWDTLGRWASGDKHVKRTTISGQGDDLGSVNVDTWSARARAGLTSWQLRVRLLRKAGASYSPSVDTIGAVASRLPKASTVTPSAPLLGRQVVLDVPRYSQMSHRGHYPQWGGGGQAWCSPTSTSMVLGYYGALPPASSYSFVPQRHPEPWVDLAARSTFDHGYDGTGNWPFNTAYAAPLAGRAFVTRLTSLRQAEQFIAAGIPLVASISFARGELSGAPIGATNGHLLVITGFTATGDVIVNDPAGATNGEVGRTYKRGEFENVWLPKSGGLVYVIADDAHPLPASPGNW